MINAEVKEVQDNLTEVSKFIANLYQASSDKELAEKAATEYDAVIPRFTEFYREQIGADKFSYMCRLFGPGSFTFHNGEVCNGYLLSVVYGKVGVEYNDLANTYRHAFAIEMKEHQLVSFREIKTDKQTFH